MIETRKFEIGWGALWRLFAFVLIAFTLFEARGIVGALLISMVISIGLDPLVKFLEKHKIPRMLGTIMSFIAGLLLFSLVLYSVMPVVIAEMGSLSSFVSAFLSSFLKMNAPQLSFTSLPSNLNETLGFLGSASASVSGLVQAVLGNMLLLFVIVVSAFYLTIEKDGPERFLTNIVSKTHESTVLNIFNNFKTKIQKWFFGQLLLSVIMGTIVGTGLWLIGVPYFLAIGILAGVLELIPMVGPILAGATGVLVALAASVPLAIYTLIFFILIQQLDGNVLFPLIMGRTMRVHPLVVMLSLLIGWNIAGFFGIILAVPSAVLIQEIFKYVGDRKEGRAE